MYYHRKHHPRKPYAERPGDAPGPPRHAREHPPGPEPESREKESAFLASLVESRARVTVVMKDGERFQGRVRYYDRDCFSLGLAGEKRKLFLRKENVACITET